MHSLRLVLKFKLSETKTRKYLSVHTRTNEISEKTFPFSFSANTKQMDEHCNENAFFVFFLSLSNETKKNNPIYRKNSINYRNVQTF